MVNRFVVLIVIFLSLGTMYAQQAYFVDGYHGGIYGHYPVEWQTRFMTDKLHAFPEWRICLEIEPETWDTVRVRTPKDYRKFQHTVKDPRVEFTNPTYAQPYCYNISGESIIRQFEYGIKKIRSHFPEVSFTTYSAEKPCFTSCLPQVLKLFGFKYAVLRCPDTCWGGYPVAYGKDLVNWVGPDGTSLLTVPRYACESFEVNSTWQTASWNNSNEFLASCFAAGIKAPVGMCFQDAGWRGGPWLGTGDKIKNHSVYTTWSEYIEKHSIGASNDDWKVSQDDFRVALMWGSQVLQQIARRVRVGENRIVMAEKMAAMANISCGYTYESERLDEAWRTLMLSQHHDSWIVPYNRLNKKHTWAEEIACWTGKTLRLSDEIIEEAVAKDCDVSPESPGKNRIRIYNTTGTARHEVVDVFLPCDFGSKGVSVYDAENRLIDCAAKTEGAGTRVYFMADVPAFGYATYDVRAGGRMIKRKASVTDSGNGKWIVENDNYRIVFDALKGGTITELIDKKGNGENIVPSYGKYGLGELKGYFYDENRFRSSTETPAKISVVQDNFFEVVLKIEGEIASHPFTQLVTLKRGSRCIDFDLQVDWKGNVGIGEYKQIADDWQKSRRGFYDDRFKLNILFPAELKNPCIYKDAPFDVCKSYQTDTHYNCWDSIKHNVILHWVDLYSSEQNCGLAVYSDHTTSYAYGTDYPLALTAQYSGVGLWGVDYRITGPLKMKYALVPHDGRWDDAALSAVEAQRNEPLLVYALSDVPLENKSFIDLKDSGYLLSAVKMTEKGMIFRLFNAEGNNFPAEFTLGFPANLREIDLNGNETGERYIGGEISVSIPRFGLKTFLIE